MSQAVVVEGKRVAKWKVEEVNELTDLLKGSKTVLIASVESFPADKLHEIRKRLRGKAVVRVTKNTLFRLAAKKSGIDVEKIDQYLTGPNAFIFTNDNPFEIYMFFEKFKLKRFAIPGDKADEEVVVPAGDTGIPAGPMLSVFGKLKIQTKVQEGKIHVVKDTVVAKPGDPIPVEIIPILQKLGIMPVHVKLKVKAAYYENLVIPGEQLHLDLEGYKNDVLRAFSEAFTLATEAVYPEPKVLENVISKAFARARALAAEAGFVTPETAEAAFARAYSKAMALASALAGKVDLGIQVATVPAGTPAGGGQVQEKKEEEKKEEEKKASEEDVGAGLSSLFG
ncbi:MAG: 50S ribosomal protein L10 [Sulfolobaceae archaeon]|nr:50S ribosomal protein L10 [Sulfolobales archaeon]